METIAIWSMWAWIGWAGTTSVLAVLYAITGVLGKRVYMRVARIYHWRVLGYWLDRLEREGTRTFERPD